LLNLKYFKKIKFGRFILFVEGPTNKLVFNKKSCQLKKKAPDFKTKPSLTTNIK
jgi:hypothetical protein